MLLVGGERAVLYPFAGDSPGQAYVFAADEQGLSQFARCLRELPPDPLAVLVDVVEEEYRAETIPHVGRVDRRAVLERKYARLFRGTPYRHALAQGREGEGRRDDRVLLTAVTRPELLGPWLGALLAQRIPVSGVYSLPILSERLLRTIGASAPNVLLISLQRASGLRQTFFRDGLLKISRLAHMPRPGSVPFAAHLVGEVEKLRRYLNSLALISRDSPLSIYILSHGALLADLEQHCRDSEQEKFVLLDVDDVGARLGLAAPGGTHYADAVFARLLARVRLPNHYAQREEMQFHTLHRLGQGLALASVLTVLGGVTFSALGFVEGVGFKQQALDAEAKAAFYQERYELARSKLPATPVEPRQIKTAVDAVAAVAAHRQQPLAALALLGRALAEQPALAIDELQWDATGDAALGKRLGADETDLPVGDYAVLDVRGHLEPFDGDYRGAIARVDELAASLDAAATVARVEVIEYPLDVRPEASVSGSAARASAVGVAEFRLRVVVGGPDGERQG